MFLLAACNNSDKEQSKSETKGSKDTVKIEINVQKTRGEKKMVVTLKKLKKLLNIKKS